MTTVLLWSTGDAKGIASSPQAADSSRLTLTGAAGNTDSSKRPPGASGEKLAEAKSKVLINAPREVVWEVLTDFQDYPHIFRRLASCRITKQEGDLVWTESDLKPHVFVRTQRQHTINDLSHKPDVLNWKVIDGNFKTVIGKWELSPAGCGDRCSVVYTLSVDPGPIIPKFLISFALRNLQKEIANSLKEWAETVSSRTSHQSEGRNRAI